jgi:thymidine kinase
MQVGRIEVIVGPMFAGKTTELLRRIERAELGRKRCCVMKYAKDKRYSVEKVSTHDYSMHDAIPCSSLMPHLDECYAYDVIGVDEAQFFSDVVEFAETLADNGKTVIVAALDGTFQRKPFGRVIELISRCESLTKLTAVCRVTGKDAAFTKRTVESNELELIGGAESYTAASRAVMLGIETKGELHLTVGPVKSGKTTELLRCLNRYAIAGRKALCIKGTKSSLRKEPSFEVRETDELPQTREIIGKYDAVGVDDAHVYEGVADWADELANNNVVVFVSSLDGDKEHVPYPEIIKLFPLCERCNKLDSVCPFTGLPAHFTTTIDGVKLFPISRLGIMNQRSLDQALQRFV